MENKQTRQSRYIRPSKDSIGRIEIQPRDCDIVRVVYDHRFMRTDHLTSLIPGDRTSIEKRLRKLWEHRYIERHFLPIIYGKESATRKAIYSLDYQGAHLLRENEDIDIRHLKRVIRDNRPGHTYVEHQLMCSNFRTTLTLALEKSNQGKLLFWRQDKGIRDNVEIGDKANNNFLPIAPDAFFCLQKEGKMMYWFLEADRYTMDHRRFLDKMKAYYLWWAKKGHSKKFDINNFRVLTICPNNLTRDRRIDVCKNVKIGIQLSKLGSALAATRKKTEIGREELKAFLRIGKDTIPKKAKVLQRDLELEKGKEKIKK